MGIEMEQNCCVLTACARSLLLRGILANNICIKGEMSDLLTWIWCASIADNLSKQDAKGPNVRFDGERAIVDGLWGCPFDGEFGSWLLGKIAKFELMLSLLLRHQLVLNDTAEKFPVASHPLKPLHPLLIQLATQKVTLVSSLLFLSLMS